MTRILPRDLRPSVKVEDVATMHKTVLDLSPQRAVIHFIDVLKKWELFGSTVFEVGVYNLLIYLFVCLFCLCLFCLFVCLFVLFVCFLFVCFICFVCLFIYFVCFLFVCLFIY